MILEEHDSQYIKLDFQLQQLRFYRDKGKKHLLLLHVKNNVVNGVCTVHEVGLIGVKRETLQAATATVVHSAYLTCTMHRRQPGGENVHIHGGCKPSCSPHEHNMHACKFIETSKYADQKIVGNSDQPIGVIVTGNLFIKVPR